MKRTFTALYQTREQAERAAEALKAAHLGDHVEIHDQRDGDASGQGRHGVLKWLSELLVGRDDSTLYEQEAALRGNFRLTAEVDDLNEIRAVQIADAANPPDLDSLRQDRRGEGWSPPPTDPAGSSPGRIQPDES